MSFRGFSPVEVDSFLDRVADEMGRLIEEKDNLLGRLEAERKSRNNLDEALAAGRELQAELVENAKRDAAAIIEKAKIKADRILDEANEELVKLRTEIKSARERRSLWLSELKMLANSLEEWADGKRTDPSGKAATVSSETTAEDKTPAGEREGETGERAA